eukprot:TRINITY_DN3023_c0_g1_i1.p1 TRINITY_DN3023_c0_g1~~TRINITY_DN3023_c0_g1_i1.p1  ORF type:complete len:529 (-),score=122.72 TRINITY_DN3023_c0_g1_i1:728-2314(-)
MSLWDEELIVENSPLDSYLKSIGVEHNTVATAYRRLDAPSRSWQHHMDRLWRFTAQIDVALDISKTLRVRGFLSEAALSSATSTIAVTIPTLWSSQLMLFTSTWFALFIAVLCAVSTSSWLLPSVIWLIPMLIVFRRLQLRAQLRSTVLALNQLMANLALYDAALERALRTVLEVELVARGFRLAPAFTPPLRHQDDGSAIQYCVRIRQAVCAATGSFMRIGAVVYQDIRQLVPDPYSGGGFEEPLEHYNGLSIQQLRAAVTATRKLRVRIATAISDAEHANAMTQATLMSALPSIIVPLSRTVQLEFEALTQLFQVTTTALEESAPVVPRSKEQEALWMFDRSCQHLQTHFEALLARILLCREQAAACVAATTTTSEQQPRDFVQKLFTSLELLSEGGDAANSMMLDLKQAARVLSAACDCATAGDTTGADVVPAVSRDTTTTTEPKHSDDCDNLSVDDRAVAAYTGLEDVFEADIPPSDVSRRSAQKGRGLALIQQMQEEAAAPVDSSVAMVSELKAVLQGLGRNK